MRRNKDLGSFLPLDRITEPFSLYVHIPFCVRKCPYCAFYSLVPRADLPGEYLHALEREICWWMESLEQDLPAIQTLYLGGGTPSLLTGDQWKRLMELLERSFRFNDNCEVSVEANPGSLTLEHLRIWKEWRVNRVSLGIQSLDEDEISLLQRPYSRNEAVRALDAVRGTGLLLSTDLMFAFPGHTLEKWHHTLREMTDHFKPHHISCYQLVIEPGTPWGSISPSSLPDGYPFYRFTQWYLQRKGYDQYEISSFARDGHYCLHNLAYWEQGNVLGIGPSAWGYLSGVRYQDHPDLASYISSLQNNGGPVKYAESVEGMEKARETAILALRTKWGFERSSFAGRFGEDALQEILKDLADIPPDLIHISPEGVSLTCKGMRVGNAIWEKIV